MNGTSDSDDDEGGWTFLRLLLKTSLVDDLWGMDNGMVGSTTSSRTGSSVGHSAPDRTNAVVQENSREIERKPVKMP